MCITNAKHKSSLSRAHELGGCELDRGRMAEDDSTLAAINRLLWLVPVERDCDIASRVPIDTQSPQFEKCSFRFAIENLSGAKMCKTMESKAEALVSPIALLCFGVACTQLMRTLRCFRSIPLSLCPPLCFCFQQRRLALRWNTVNKLGTLANSRRPKSTHVMCYDNRNWISPPRYSASHCTCAGEMAKIEPIVCEIFKDSNF